MVTGYMHPDYAESLREFGIPRQLSRCGGWILERDIPETLSRDGMGIYPLFFCQDWSQLHKDLESLGNELVALSLVTDPFGGFDPAYLRRHFEIVLPFKEHFVTDLRQPMNIIVSKKHRYNARRALRDVYVERCSTPTDFLDDWLDLYTNLIKRHNITGIRTFSREAFAKQLAVPGMLMFRAVYQGETVGINLIYVQDDVAYTHLSAFSSRGYELRASYAIRWTAIEYLADRVCWLDLGASAGTERNTDGLSYFKQGWSTGTRTAYFCGRIFDHNKYAEIVRAKNSAGTDYFPAYRKGEFG